MTTPIRPGIPTPVQPPQRSGAVSDAQRAFFQAALQGVQPATPTATRPAVTPTVQTQAAPSQAAAEPQAIRVGRYLDIRV